MDRMDHMSKKDYETIAKCIRDAFGMTGNFTIRECLISSLCAKFAEDNPRFDSDRFKAACRMVENQA